MTGPQYSGSYPGITTELRASDGVAPDGLPISRWRAALVHLTLVLFAAAIVARAAQLQILEETTWSRVAQEQHVREVPIAPPRGSLVDATGTVLVETRELMTLAISPGDLKPVRRKAADGVVRLRDTRALLKQGLRDLRVPDSLIRRALDPRRKWVPLPQRFLPSELEPFVGLPGIHRQRVLRRVNSAPEGLRGVVGALNTEGNPVGGLELELDPLLRGASGSDPVVLDGRGGRIGSPMLTPVAARPGHTVVLTINQSLQEIAEQQLAAAREQTGSSGGDVVILDPRDGAILALAGVRNGTAASTSTPLAEPYEPGSVIKPFVISRLLDLRRARADEQVNTENGEWKLASRTLRDEHKEPFMTVRDVIRLSSNIGTAKLAMRLSQKEEYETLRDFGFGAYTGVPYPAESRGRLPLPARWGAMTPASVAIGYEMSATPVQIAAAYGALANGGDLLQPVLVREVRGADGALLYRHERRLVRRVIAPATATLMREMLKSVVDSGTARAANLATFEVAGKSGTARRNEPGKGYAAGRYNATFAGMFPASDPQYVIVARLIDPQGSYYGGTVSGGMVNGIIQAALATRDASLDRTKLAQVAKLVAPPVEKPLTPAQRLAQLRDSLRQDSLRAPAPPKAEPQSTAAHVMVALPLAPVRAEVPPPAELRAVPAVYGLDLRQAVRTLNAAGFQVSVTTGRELRTRPEAGVLLRAGSTVQLQRPIP